MFNATKDLVPGKELSLGSFTGAPADLARLYNAADFSYTPGQPIPIVLSRSTFQLPTFDMGGKDTITIPASVDAQKSSPQQSHFLTSAFDKSALKGKEFTAILGGMRRIPTASMEATHSQNSQSETYKRLSPAAIAKLEKEQRDNVSPYWDYDKLNAGLTMRFKIVGFNDSLDTYTQYIPDAAARSLMQQLYDLQRAARTAKALPEDAYQATFGGWRLTKSGQVVEEGIGLGFELQPLQRLGDAATDVNIATSIPGWVYQFHAKDGVQIPSEAVGLVVKPESLPIKSVSVTLDDAGNREKAQKALTQAGYPEAAGSYSFTNSLRGISKGINTALFWIVLVLGAINALILASAVSRSVSDAQREIGVYRALGARRRDIRLLYVVYATLQTALGVGLGLILGLLAMWPLSGYLTKVFSGIVGVGGADSLVDSWGLNLTVHAADLQHVDLPRIALYGLALIVVTVVVSLLPAARAARISPVESIRRGE
jgi:hypothetical protein